jgi:hypothetical protein
LKKNSFEYWRRMKLQLYNNEEMEAYINLSYAIVALLSLQNIVDALQQFAEVGEIID